MREYGYGDSQTWGGLSPEPSGFDVLREKVDEELSNDLYDALDSVNMAEAHEVVLRSAVYQSIVDRETIARWLNED